MQTVGDFSAPISRKAIPNHVEKMINNILINGVGYISLLEPVFTVSIFLLAQDIDLVNLAIFQINSFTQFQSFSNNYVQGVGVVPLLLAIQRQNIFIALAHIHAGYIVQPSFGT